MNSAKVVTIEVWHNAARIGQAITKRIGSRTAASKVQMEASFDRACKRKETRCKKKEGHDNRWGQAIGNKFQNLRGTGGIKKNFVLKALNRGKRPERNIDCHPQYHYIRVPWGGAREWDNSDCNYLTS